MRLLRRERQGSARPRPRAPWHGRGGAAGAAVLVLIGTGWWLHHNGVIAHATAAVEQQLLAWTGRCGLAVSSIEVEGRQRASREAILGALGVANGAPILSVDPADAKRRIETITWVHSADVERRLPDTIHVRVVERQPLALWQRQGKLTVIDRDGVVISGERPETFADLIILVGSDAPAHGTDLIDMLQSEKALASHIAAAIRVGGRRWNLRFDSGVDVALPEEDPAGAWRRLAALEESDGILERDVEMIDLRLPDRLVLRTPDPQKPAGKKPRQAGKAT
jgi:cell division protein FtsQ